MTNEVGRRRQVVPEHRAGWPRTLPCLRCSQAMRATWPGHRLCDDCRGAQPDVVYELRYLHPR